MLNTNSTTTAINTTATTWGELAKNLNAETKKAIDIANNFTGNDDEGYFSIFDKVNDLFYEVYKADYPIKALRALWRHKWAAAFAVSFAEHSFEHVPDNRPKNLKQFCKFFRQAELFCGRWATPGHRHIEEVHNEIEKAAV